MTRNLGGRGKGIIVTFVIELWGFFPAPAISIKIAIFDILVTFKLKKIGLSSSVGNRMKAIFRHFNAGEVNVFIYSILSNISKTVIWTDGPKHLSSQLYF